MQWFLYIVWIAVPVAFLFLGLLMRFRQYLFPHQTDDLMRPLKILRTGKIFLFCSLASFLLDVLVIENADWAAPGSFASDYGRWAVWPLVLALVMTLCWARSLLFSQSEGRSFKYETFAASNAVLLIGSLAVGVIFFGRPLGASLFPEYFSAQPPSRLAGYGSMPGHGVAWERQPSDEGVFDRTMRRLENWMRHGGLFERKKAGRQVEAGSSAVLPHWVDFNREAHIVLRPLVRQFARESVVDPNLAEAMVEIGSGYNASFVYDQRFYGLMQLSAEHVKRLQVRDPLDARQNLRAAMKILAHLQEKYGSQIELIVAAYRWGEGEVDYYEGVPPEPEVEAYVKRVLSVYELFKAQPK